MVGEVIGEVMGEAVGEVVGEVVSEVVGPGGWVRWGAGGTRCSTGMVRLVA